MSVVSFYLLRSDLSGKSPSNSACRVRNAVECPFSHKSRSVKNSICSIYEIQYFHSKTLKRISQSYLEAFISCLRVIPTFGPAVCYAGVSQPPENPFNCLLILFPGSVYKAESLNKITQTASVCRSPLGNDSQDCQMQHIGRRLDKPKCYLLLARL